MSVEDYSLINKQVDPTSSFWKKKYTLLLKRAENVEKQNMRIINRIYQVKKAYQQISKERKFLMKRLDKHNDCYRSVKFFNNTDLLMEGNSEYKQPLKRTISKQTRTGKPATNKNHKDGPPKKPLNAFLRFCQAQREAVTQEYPDISNQELTKILSKNWNMMLESDKEMYYNMFDEDRVRYEGELEIYKQKQKKKEENKANQVDDKMPSSLDVLANTSRFAGSPNESQIDEEQMSND